MTPILLIEQKLTHRNKRDKKVLLRVMIFFSLFFIQTLQANETDSQIEAIAKTLYAAQQHAPLFPDTFDINPNLSEGELYRIQKSYIEKRLASGKSIVGFKGGLMARGPIAGVLFGDDDTKDDNKNTVTKVSLSKYKTLVIEAELAFVFCEKVTTAIADVQQLKENICALTPAIEIADLGVDNFATIKKDLARLRYAVIPMNAGSEKLLLGQRHPESHAEKLDVTMAYQGEAIGTPNMDMLNSDRYYDYVLWVVNEFVIKQGYHIEAGQFILPGNLTGIHIAQPGIYQASFSGLGSLRIEIVE